MKRPLFPGGPSRHPQNRLRGKAVLARAGRSWVWTGMALGVLIASVLYAPAAWLASWVNGLSGQRVLLAEAEGSIWTGNAVLVLAGGPGSQAARALPGRLVWRLRPQGLGLKLALEHACCLAPGAQLAVKPGWGEVSVIVGAGASASALNTLGQWPAAWLVGLGTPWNTLQPGGALHLSTRELHLQWAQGRFRMTGQAQLELRDFSSRLTQLPRLGSYRLDATGDGQGPTQLQLSTLDGALKMQAEGTLGASGLRLRGEATAAEADQGVLNNLLNIIGRRQGARSLISIG
jgi:general secretion pathway protein N